jgi:Zn-dependent protease
MEVMDANVSLGKIAGIRVGVHWSLLLIFWLVVWSLAGGQLPHAAPGHATGAYWIAALCAGVIFYGCLLAHELAHSVVARHRNIDVEGIVLWLLGGVSKFKSEPADPEGELRIAIAGPATSAALAVGFFVLSRLSSVGHPGSLLAGTFGWLGWINALLAVFNLLPAFPLDGGRVLRSMLWRHNRNKQQATNIAARSGAVFGYGFIVVGLASLAVAGLGINGLWLAAIGWFLVSASKSEARASVMAGNLAGWRVMDAMTPAPLTVPTWASLDRLMEEGVHNRRLSSFPVVDINGSFVGLVTLARIRRVSPSRWGETNTASIACPIQQCVTCRPDDDLVIVARAMYASADRRAVVLADGGVIGVLSPSDLQRIATLSGSSQVVHQ